MIEDRGVGHPALRVALLICVAIAAGSGFAVAALLFLHAFAATVGSPLQLGLQLGERSHTHVIVQGAFATGLVLVTYSFRRWLDRRSLLSLGLDLGPGWFVEALFGFALGALLMASIFASELAMGAYSIRGLAWQQQTPSSIFGMLALTFLGFVVVAFNEELLARGYVLQNLELAWGMPAAVVLSSVIFSLGHLLNPGAGLASSIGILSAGLQLAAGYVATRRLWLPIGLHLSWNFFQGPVFGFNVSGLASGGLLVLEPVGPPELTGGAFGPEASIIGIAADLVGLALIRLLVPFLPNSPYRVARLRARSAPQVSPGETSLPAHP